METRLTKPLSPWSVGSEPWMANRKILAGYQWSARTRERQEPRVNIKQQVVSMMTRKMKVPIFAVALFVLGSCSGQPASSPIGPEAPDAEIWDGYQGGELSDQPELSFDSRRQDITDDIIPDQHRDSDLQDVGSTKDSLDANPLDSDTGGFPEDSVYQLDTDAGLSCIEICADKECGEVGDCLCGSCDDGNLCTVDSCAPDFSCQFEANVVACDDGSACTANDTCTDGECKGTPISCNDENICTDDGCDPASGCWSIGNSNPCDDGNPCTAFDVCIESVCIGAGNADCDDGNACTTDACVVDVGCVYVTISCDDAIDCTVDTCDPVIGCINTPDHSLCPPNTACAQVSCWAAYGCWMNEWGPPCDDNDPCTTDYCDMYDGCSAEPQENGSPCSSGGVCSMGYCLGCTPGICEEYDWTCQYGQCVCDPGEDVCKECGINGCGSFCGHCPFPQSWAVGESWSCVDGYCEVLWEAWADMVVIPAGDFIQGPPDNEQTVYLDSFLVDAIETTETEFCTGVFDQNFEPSYCLGIGESWYPASAVTWYGAKLYCENTGRRLCSAAEWEKASRGTEGAPYPWGDQLPNCSMANYSACIYWDGPCPTENVVEWGTFGSPYGVHFTSGNVSEWVEDDCEWGHQAHGGSYLNWKDNVTSYSWACEQDEVKPSPWPEGPEHVGVRCCADL